MIFVGLDDTDTLESRGTGHLARHIAATIGQDYRVLGVTRHQLLLDPRVPCTKKNSCAAIVLEVNGQPDLDHLKERVQKLMLDSFEPGSDPGLCIAPTVPQAISQFGRRAQQQLVTKAEAEALAAAYGLSLLGLGGDCGGVIGALAAVGLAATGEDGRYVSVGRSRELSGLQSVATIMQAGVAAVRTVDGQGVSDGLVQTDKLRPARRGGQAVAVVEWCHDHWLPLKLD
jgi:tRNA(Ile2) C34 agmatinyltransferase TiaS